MQFAFSVGVRLYGQHACVVQTLQPPYLSAAAAEADQALEKLAGALRDTIERTHPSRVARWLEPDAWEISAQELEMHRGVEAFGDPGDEVVWLTQPVSVASCERAQFLEWIALEFGLSARGEDEEAVLRALTLQLRRDPEHTSHHRPIPDEAWIQELTIEASPLDLIRVPADVIWLERFEDDALHEADPSERPAAPTLESTAELWSHASPREAAQRGLTPVFAREPRVHEIEELLDSKHPTPVVLVGPARVGKTAIVKHLAYTRAGLAPDEGRRLWFASPPRLCATDAMSAGWQQQCKELFADLETTDDILYMGRLVEALDAGKFVGSDYNLAQFMKPLLADRRVRVIAEATPGEWNLIEQRDIGFARTFHVVRVQDPPEAFAFEEIITPAALRLAQAEEITLTPQAIARAWALQQRFASEGSVVGRTIDFLARVARRASSAYKAQVDDQDLISAFCDSTGLPEFMLHDDRTLDMAQVIATLEQRVIGQREAVERVADVIGITKAGLAPPDRPLGSFLFVGPTGVGKTELARALAQFLFGEQDRLVRLDMSEYSHADAYGRLIGEGLSRTLEADLAPGGDLTGPVRRQPFCVVLLDEIEKAHSSVFDVLLQVLGEARLTDAHGRTTRFQNTIVIMTSNLGVDSLKPSIGFSDETQLAAGWSAHFRREAERFFRPEFLARIDQFIPFRPLEREVVSQIAARELEKLSLREGIARQDVGFEWSPEVAQWVAARGWDPQYGARPLKRVIEREICWPLARRLAQTQHELDTTQARAISLDVHEDALRWELRVVDASEDNEHASRQILLELIEHIAGLRRRLQNYTYTGMFSDLEWEVENFDVSSQSNQFWSNPHAAEMAAQAERARRIVTPAAEIALELGALEDLAHEAYHSRSFDIRDDLRERVQELSPAVRQLFLVILRSAFHHPDELTLVLPARRHADPWRAQLVRWYAQLAQKLGYSFELSRALTSSELEAIPLQDLQASTRAYYRRCGIGPAGQVPSSEVLVIELKGFAVRPLLLGEHGLHRLISAEGNAVTQVLLLDEEEQWPVPDAGLGEARDPGAIARVWNRRTREISIPYYASATFDERDPWAALLPIIEDVAWMIVESRWE